MERTPLLPLPEGMLIKQIQDAETRVIITVIATRPTSCCPLCLEPSSSIHSLYNRTVADVPCGGRQIQLLLTVRKFFCHHSLCERKIFTERLPELVDLSERTIQHWLASETFPEAKKRRKRQSCFDTFAPYVLKRWQEGEHHGTTLRREIMEQGYTGSERTVYRYLETLKQAAVKASANLHRLQKFSANTAVWLFVRDPQTLDDIEQEDLAAFSQASMTLKRAYDLIQDFLLMVRKREGHR